MATFHPSTHRKIALHNGQILLAYYPTTTFEVTGDGLDNDSVALSSLLDEFNELSQSAIKQAAFSYVEKALGGIPSGSKIGYTSGYSTGKMTYAYVHQEDSGLKITNAVANIAWRGDHVVAFGCSFKKMRSKANKNPTLSVESVKSTAESALNGTHNDHPTSLEYFVLPSGDLALAHVIQIQNKEADTRYDAFVDAHSGQLLSAIDYVWNGTYKVLPIPGQAEPPSGFQKVTDPQDDIASPLGWHTVGTTSTTSTEGNNALVYKGGESKTTEQSSSPLIFDYPFKKDKEPNDTSDTDNLNAARVNAFYLANKIHDLFYRYEFTEVAFNFQEDNFGKGGQEGDRVKVSVQDNQGTNNSWFDPHPDGTSGTCHLYLYTKTTPKRDSALDNGIVIHELTHGLTVRMTGGGTGHSLQPTESHGLGEGWSDAMADWAYQTSAPIKDYKHAVYATGNDNGNRLHPYSTSEYDLNLNTMKEAHHIGQVWANLLHVIHAALVDKHGFSTTAMTNPDGTEGNIVFLHLFIDALALQPIRPTFVFARQAWIQADANRYNGANERLLWKAFASRGLGIGAKTKDHNGKYVVTAGWKQKVKAQLIKTDSKYQATVFFDGQSKESLSLETDTTKKTVT
ncbi:hypothetical protein GALMADRAFT_228748 [Galerina marginata CBS 339.88]|uniref:Extracellular metalloproteinase n=1 Tax=Galerina marginata (strain CBS 339.88) TaxID=685588 RepID=A0A067SSQ3_GALM3|nr:hypothetical protein GALMADRAFT_228748 [Galerina marginata CBS 339.88]